jgi:hypothetical protein
MHIRHTYREWLDWQDRQPPTCTKRFVVQTELGEDICVNCTMPVEQHA